MEYIHMRLDEMCTCFLDIVDIVHYWMRKTQLHTIDSLFDQSWIHFHNHTIRIEMRRMIESRFLVDKSNTPLQQNTVQVDMDHSHSVQSLVDTQLHTNNIHTHLHLSIDWQDIEDMRQWP